MGVTVNRDGLSIAEGPPLADEPGMGALTIPGYLEEVVARHADSEAVVLAVGGHELRWTYAQLLAHSQAVARALVACGVGRGDRVGILMTNRPEYLAALFGIAMAGGVSVALSTFSTEPELDQLLAAADISVLLFEDAVLNKDFAALLARLEPGLDAALPGAIASARYPYLRHRVRLDGITGSSSHTPPSMESWTSFLDRGATIADEVVEARSRAVCPTDAGGLFFSSGTTNLPKGILHTQRAFAIQWWRWPRVYCIGEPARCWTGNGFFWSGNVTMVVGCALSTGGAMVLQPLFDADEALHLVEAERVTMMNGRPHQWARLEACEAWADADLHRLRYVTKGEIIHRHPTVDTDWEVPNAFGTTESMTIVSCIDAAASEADYAGSFGLPLPGNTLKIIDPLSGDVVPMGERGEICLKGPTLMLGYIGIDPAVVFDDSGYYRTGDGGYLDAQGRLYWEGRLNDIIKTGGANVSPEEVDTAIAAFPGVKRSQTVGVPHDTLGEMVVACVVPVQDGEFDEQALMAFLKERLASFKLPRHVLVVSDAEISLTGNEKVKPAQVRDLAMKKLGVEPAPAPGG